MSYEPAPRPVTAIYTPRKHVRVGSCIILANDPVIEVHNKGEDDFITVNELLLQLYGKSVSKIIFKEDEENQNLKVVNE